MMTQITNKQFRLYAPQSTKSYTTEDDGSLIIEGIASTTNKDLTGDVVLPSAIKSMKQQLQSPVKTVLSNLSALQAHVTLSSLSIFCLI